MPASATQGGHKDVTLVHYFLLVVAINSFSINGRLLGKQGGADRLCMLLWLFVYCTSRVWLK